MTLQDYQQFYFELRREALRRGFVSNMIFFQDHAKGREELRRTLDDFGVDLVVWFLPRISSKETILSLKDKGLRVIGISDGGTPGMRCQYEIHREKALIAILQRWRGDGLNQAIVIRTNSGSEIDQEMIEHAAEAVGLSCEYRDLDEETVRETAIAVLYQLS